MTHSLSSWYIFSFAVAMFAKRGNISLFQHPPWCRLSAINPTPQSVDFLVGDVAEDLGWLSSLKYPRK